MVVQIRSVDRGIIEVHVDRSAQGPSGLHRGLGAGDRGDDRRKSQDMLQSRADLPLVPVCFQRLATLFTALLGGKSHLADEGLESRITAKAVDPGIRLEVPGKFEAPFTPVRVQSEANALWFPCNPSPMCGR